jgi:hypothetical protein
LIDVLGKNGLAVKKETGEMLREGISLYVMAQNECESRVAWFGQKEGNNARAL